MEVKKAGLKQWRKLTQAMPNLVAVTIDANLKEDTLQGLKSLAYLQKLHLKCCSGLVDIEIVKDVVNFRQLSHLTLCKVTSIRSPALICVAQLKNLEALTLHTKEGLLPEEALQYVLFRLPKLKELSLTVSKMNKSRLSSCFTLLDSRENLQKEQACVTKLHLERLDLIDCGNTSLSEEALDQLSTLHCVGLWNHKKFLLGTEDILEVMLKKLPNLTELDLAWATSFEPYVNYIPSNLEALSVIGTKVSNSTLSWLADCAGKINHLNLKLSHGFDEKILKRFPDKFPSLKTLGLSNTTLNEEALLCFAKLRLLQRLDISNIQHLSQEAIHRFRVLTDNRVQVIQEDSLLSFKYCYC